MINTKHIMYYNKYKKYKKLYIAGSSIENKLSETDTLFINIDEVRKPLYLKCKMITNTTSSDDEDDDEEVDEKDAILSFYNSCRVVACFYSVCFLNNNNISNIYDAFMTLSDCNFIGGNIEKTNDYKIYNSEISDDLSSQLSEGISILGIFFENNTSRDTIGRLSPLHYIFILKSGINIYIRQAWLTSGQYELSKTVEQMSAIEFNLDSLVELTKPNVDYRELIKNIFDIDDEENSEKGPFYLQWIDQQMIFDILNQ